MTAQYALIVRKEEIKNIIGNTWNHANKLEAVKKVKQDNNWFTLGEISKAYDELSIEEQF